MRFLAGFFLVNVLVSSQATFGAEPVLEISLWDGGPPGSTRKDEPTKIRTTDQGEHVVSNVHNPQLAVHLPQGNATGTAIVIAPGGGHRELWVDHEGHNLARWLAERGIAGIVLTYRLAREEGSTYTIKEEAMADMRRAMRLVRSRAAQWKIDPAKIGALGYSAGGELCYQVSTDFDDGDPNSADPIEQQGCRPDFLALIYPGRSTDFIPHENVPPTFLANGYQDRPDISRGMAELYLRFKDAKVPAELHIYATAGHGFGMRESTSGAVAKWPDRFVEWLADIKMLDREE